MSVAYANRAQVLSVDYEIDWRYLASRIRASKGKVVVAMHPNPESIGGILIPESQQQIQAAVGTIVAVPPESFLIQGKRIDYPEPGTVVLVHPEDGSRIEFEGQVLKSIGAFLAPEEWVPQSCDWFESIVAELKDDMVKAYGDKIIVQLDPKRESQGGILIPDSAQTWQADGTVVSVGPLHEDCAAEDRVCVDMNLLTSAGLEFTLGKGYERMFVVPPEAISFVYLNA